MRGGGSDFFFFFLQENGQNFQEEFLHWILKDGWEEAKQGEDILKKAQDL